MKEFFLPEKLTWNEIRSKVKKVNPDLFMIIEQFNPGKLPLYKVKYPYGAKIVDEGKFNLVNEDGNTVPIRSKYFSKEIQESLSYRSIPLALVLHNASEIFVEDETRIVPLRLLKPGELFGVFELLDQPSKESSASITNVSAGARSAFMLAKISDAIHHRKLINDLDLLSTLPKGQKEHGLVFSDIGHTQKYITEWHNEILFFPAVWFDPQDNQGWLKFINYIYKIGWHQSEYRRIQTVFELLWETLVSAILQKNIRPRPYLVNTVKHLIFMATGNIPGFKPAGTDELALPLKTIQEEYLNSYGLKFHNPIIMIPSHYSLNTPGDSVYYSLSYPTLFEYSLNPKLKPTTIEDLRNVKLIIELLQNKLEQTSDPIYNAIGNVNFDYFTSDQDVLGKVKSSKELVNIDPTFSVSCNKDAASRTFPYSSHFFRGCVRISRKSDNAK